MLALRLLNLVSNLWSFNFSKGDLLISSVLSSFLTYEVINFPNFWFLILFFSALSNTLNSSSESELELCYFLCFGVKFFLIDSKIRLLRWWAIVGVPILESKLGVETDERQRVIGVAIPLPGKVSGSLSESLLLTDKAPC
jgi:hypothetical protein